MNHLLPCPGCTRHVRVVETVCPFCGEALPLSLRQRIPRLPTRRLGRSATFAFGAALAASACSEAHSGGGDPDAQVATDGGAGTMDAGADDRDAGPPALDAGTDSGGAVPAYGAPSPVDAGDPSDFDAGGVIAHYGGPPLRLDAGNDPGQRDAGGGIVPLYGGAPE